MPRGQFGEVSFYGPRAVKRVSDARVAQRERALLEAFDHPHIVKLVDFDERTGELVMENGGVDLFDEIPPKEEQPSVVRQLVRALVYLHARGVAHLDVKLENVVRTPAGHVRLVDFGMALSFADDGTDRRIMGKCGTEGYMAPEMLRRAPFDPFKVDVWSLGVLVFAMHHKYMPFVSAEPTDWRYERFSAAQARGAGPVDALASLGHDGLVGAPVVGTTVAASLHVRPEARWRLSDLEVRFCREDEVAADDRRTTSPEPAAKRSRPASY